MALITIPTSIGGLNIPAGIFGGPLGSLYRKGGLEYVQYPRDLGSATKSHSILFTIEEIQETKLQDVGTFFKGLGRDFSNFINGTDGSAGQPDDGSYDRLENARLNRASGDASAVVSSPLETFNKGVDTAIGGIESVSNALGGFTREVSSRKGIPVCYIALYMPENFNITSNMSYDDTTTIASAAGALPLIGSVVSKVTDKLQNNDAAKLALNRAGYVFNPQKQMLFQGIEFREFNLSFTFTPYSQREAEDVKKIIKMFRMWSAPKTSSAGAGMFFVPPALFGVEFQFQGKINPNLPKLERCVVESVDVNYAPNGWAAHSDGAPIQTTMAIQLKEIVLIDRAKVNAGY
jgi:hypothetical protein